MAKRDRTGLSAEALERRLGAALERGERGELLERDWRAFFREELDLSDEDRRDLDALPERDVQRFQEAFSKAVGSGSIDVDPDQVTVFTHTEDVEQQEPDPGGVVMHCHRAPKLKDWRCFFGPHKDDEVHRKDRKGAAAP